MGMMSARRTLGVGGEAFAPMCTRHERDGLVSLCHACVSVGCSEALCPLGWIVVKRSSKASVTAKDSNQRVAGVLRFFKFLYSS
jgi:hypothetical protein